MKRRGFFSALFGASGAAVAKPTAPAKLKMRFPLCECSCGYCPPHEGHAWDESTFAVCRNPVCPQYGIPVVPYAEVEVKPQDRQIVERIHHEQHMGRIQAYRRAWAARAEMGYSGPIKGIEEGNYYAGAYIRDGKMQLSGYV